MLRSYTQSCFKNLKPKSKSKKNQNKILIHKFHAEYLSLKRLWLNHENLAFSMREAARFPPFENVPSLSIELKAMIKANTGDGLWLSRLTRSHQLRIPQPFVTCYLYVTPSAAEVGSCTILSIGTFAYRNVPRSEANSPIPLYFHDFNTAGRNEFPCFSEELAQRELGIKHLGILLY